MGMLFTALEEAKVPAILFMDELEAIGGKRDQNTRGGADNARTSTLSVLLRKIEDFKGYAIAATNKQDFIDPALWRRFHIQMTVDLPGYDERYAILSRYCAPFELPAEAIAVIADLTDGASPALLRGLMEGMKRNLIIHPRMSLPIDSPEKIFVPIITSLKPPPEMPEIALWKNPAAIHAISESGWPPEMPNE
jgi:SpoVK/Ycf46/Vps4 family AAA+-type ATPase